MNKLLQIQAELKAPKNQYNSFGKYKYRSTEDILEAIKPLLVKHGCTLFLSDEIVCLGSESHGQLIKGENGKEKLAVFGQHFYTKTTATFIDGELTTKTYGWAREDEFKAGMDASQITGTSASYAAKRALGNMFLIDDTKDADSTNDHGKDEVKPHSESAKPTEPLTATGMVKDKGKANAGGYVPYTLDNQQMDDGKDIKFTTKTQTFMDILDNALENGNKVHITYSKTEYRGYCSIHSVIPVLKE